MSEQPKEAESKPEKRQVSDESLQGVPIGAILITSFLALMILISWFGVYFLDFIRS